MQTMKETKRWNFPGVAKAVALSLLYMGIFVFVMYTAADIALSLTHNPVFALTALPQAIGAIVATGIFYLIMRMRNGMTTSQEDGRFFGFRKTDGTDKKLALVLVVAGAVVSIGWTLLIQAIEQVNQTLEWTVEYEQSMDQLMVGVPVWQIIFYVVIAGPIVEEFLFRGLIFGELRRVMPIWAAMVSSGLIFGFFHLNWVQGGYTSFLGVLLALVYFTTDSLALPIGMHILNNAVVFFPTIPGIGSLAVIAYLIASIVCLFKLMKNALSLLEKKRDRDRYESYLRSDVDLTTMQGGNDAVARNAQRQIASARRSLADLYTVLHYRIDDLEYGKKREVQRLLSVISQRIDGLHGSGFVGWIESEQKAYGRGEEYRDYDYRW